VLEFVEQRRFANARLAGHEGDLPLTLRCPGQTVVQLREGFLPSYEEDLCWTDLGRRGLPGLAADRCDESVAAPRQCLNVAWMPGVVTEHLAQLQHLVFQHFRLNVSARPQVVEQLIVIHELAGTLNQVSQHVERLRCQCNAHLLPGICPTPNALVGGIEPELEKPCRVHRGDIPIPSA